MRTNELDTLVQTLAGLSEAEQKSVIDRIMNMMQTTREEKSGCNAMVKEHTFQNGKPNCPHCRAQANLGFIVKKGYKNGVQRYYCKSCRCFFVATTNTVFARSRKDAEVWRKFIQMTISGANLASCASECHLAYQTAFTWRHKLLNVFKTHQNSTQMNGVVEMDEMLIPISFKGNHIQGGFSEKRTRGINVDNGLPRPSFQRGSDNKSVSSKDKACVFCMVSSQGKAFYARVPGLGFMQNDMLNATVCQHVSKENSLILVDQYRITRNFLDNNGYQYMSLSSNISENTSDHKPEVHGELHLQHVNAMHRHIRRFLAKYCGVSSKYLENYISLFIWLKNVSARNQKKQIQKYSLIRASESDCYITRQELQALPAIPICA